MNELTLTNLPGHLRIMDPEFYSYQLKNLYHSASLFLKK